MAEFSLEHPNAVHQNGITYLIGYRDGAQYLRRSADNGRTWLAFEDGSTERLVASPSDAQRAALVKMESAGRRLIAVVPVYPELRTYVSEDDGETWERAEG